MAHTAAVLGHLPDDFDQWELADKNRETVIQAVHRHLELDEGLKFPGAMATIELYQAQQIKKTMHLKKGSEDKEELQAPLL